MSRKLIEPHKSGKPYKSGRKEKSINAQDEIAHWLGQRLKAALEVANTQIKLPDHSPAPRALVD